MIDSSLFIFLRIPRLLFFLTQFLPKCLSPYFASRVHIYLIDDKDDDDDETWKKIDRQKGENQTPLVFVSLTQALILKAREEKLLCDQSILY